MGSWRMKTERLSSICWSTQKLSQQARRSGSVSNECRIPLVRTKMACAANVCAIFYAKITNYQFKKLQSSFLD